MDVFELIVSITCLIAAISIPLSLFSLKKYIENLISDEKQELKTELEAWLNSEKGAKALYSIGALIMAGAKDSIPIIGKGGKFKWQDLLGQIAGGAAKKFLGLDFSGQGEQTEPQKQQQTTTM